VEGGDLTGKRVVIVEDVISTGGAVRDAKARLDEAGAVTVAVVCAVWRGPLPARIEGLDAPVFAAVTLEDLQPRNSP
ncbi:MAG: phosphoribosyltransferase family protein, partial [Phenylobacterium sp.]